MPLAAINRNASLNGAPNPRGHWDHKSLQAEATTSSKPRAWCSFLWRSTCSSQHRMMQVCVSCQPHFSN